MALRGPDFGNAEDHCPTGRGLPSWVNGRKFKIIVAFVLVLLVGPFLVPIPPLRDTVPPRALSDSDSLFTDVNGIAVHYKVYGSGKPVIILLHGFGASLFSWREVVQPLAQNYTVVAFDRPAFGLTERPLRGNWTGENPYSAQGQVALTLGLTDKLGIERAVIVGHSAGGTIGLLIALDSPGRVQALVLVDASVYSGHTGSLLRTLSKIPQVRHLAPLFVGSVRSWGKRLLVQSWHNSSRITQEIMDGYTKPLRADDWDQGLLESTLAAQAPDIEDRLASLSAPVLVITGDDDRVVAPEQSARLAQDLPGAKLVVIPQCGHLPHEECPAPFFEAVLEFLRSLPATSRDS